MQKLMLLAAGLATVATIGAAAAPADTTATKTVKITATAFTPSSVTVKTGDAVKWTNTDAKNHQIVATSGAFASPVLKPKESYTFTFRSGGRFPYRDALDSKLRGTVVVQGQPPAVTAAVSRPIIAFGDTITLSGTVSNHKVGEKVAVFYKPWPQNSFQQLTTVLTTTNGAWDLILKPTILTTYQVVWNNTTSAQVTVAVRPSISLSYSRGYFYTRVKAARSYWNRHVYLERLSRFGQWVAIKKLTLGHRSGRLFRLELAHGTSRLRVFMSVNQAGPGYLSSTSPTLVFRQR
jgi:plastocyanin